jgi:hypothetical protein
MNTLFEEFVQQAFINVVRYTTASAGIQKPEPLSMNPVASMVKPVTIRERGTIFSIVDAKYKRDAAYWYGRAGKPVSREQLDAEYLSIGTVGVSQSATPATLSRCVALIPLCDASGRVPVTILVGHCWPAMRLPHWDTAGRFR